MRFFEDIIYQRTSTRHHLIMLFFLSLKLVDNLLIMLELPRNIFRPIRPNPDLMGRKRSINTDLLRGRTYYIRHLCYTREIKKEKD